MSKKSMRILTVLLAAAVLLAGTGSALAAEEFHASIPALEVFSTVWNDYYSSSGIPLTCGYLPTDDGSMGRGIYIVYEPSSDDGWPTDLVPSSSSLYFLYLFENQGFSVWIVNDRLEGDLESAVVYTSGHTFENVEVESSHEDTDLWGLLLPDEVLSAFSQDDSIIVSMTVNGRSRHLEIDRQHHPRLYEMAAWIVHAKSYTDENSELYLKSEYLPSVTKAPIPEQDTSVRKYSFREDYEAIEHHSQSVFYVEIFDSSSDLLGTASGFVAFDGHYFVTNQHVIEDAAYLVVYDDKNVSYRLDTVMISDKELDLAILEFPDGDKYDPLVIAGESKLLRGQPVVTIGSPKGFQNTVAFGNISAFQVLEKVSMIQFTAPISHGSSGGCLFNDSGELIGITSKGNTEGENLGFAIPVSYLTDLFESWDHTTVTLGSARSWDTVHVTPVPGVTAAGDGDPEMKTDIRKDGVLDDWYNILPKD